MKRPLRLRWCWATCVLVCSVTSPARPAPPLVQLPAPHGCVSNDGTGGACGDGVALANATAVTVSPDGRNVYVGTEVGNSVAILDRDLATGALTQKAGIAGCVSETGTGGACADGEALTTVSSVASSPDGRSVYVTSVGSDAVAVFDRDPATGALTQKAGLAGCVSETGSAGACVDGKALIDPIQAVVSPDGRSLYVASRGSDAVAVFDRDPATGALTQKAGTAGCVSQTGSGGLCGTALTLGGAQGVAVSPDGRSVYATSGGEDTLFTDAVLVFDRNPATGALTQKAGTAGCVSDSGTAGFCADGRALLNAYAVEVSPDGRSVYVAAEGSDAIAVFDRDPATGALAQKGSVAGCASEIGSGEGCNPAAGLQSPLAVRVSSDGRNVYVAGSVSSAVAVFERFANGTIQAYFGAGRCISETGTGGTCTDGLALVTPRSLDTSRDGRSVYVATSFSAAVGVFSRDVQRLDIDGDGEVTALGDGVMLMRYSAGAAVSDVPSGAVDLDNCHRCLAAEIYAFLNAQIQPP